MRSTLAAWTQGKQRDYHTPSASRLPADNACLNGFLTAGGRILTPSSRGRGLGGECDCGSPGVKLTDGLGGLH